MWLVGYIDVNKRFPKPEQQVHSIGEWVRTGDTSIKVNSVEYMPQEEQTANMDQNFSLITGIIVILIIL